MNLCQITYACQNTAVYRVRKPPRKAWRYACKTHMDQMRKYCRDKMIVENLCAPSQ